MFFPFLFSKNENICCSLFKCHVCTIALKTIFTFSSLCLLRGLPHSISSCVFHIAFLKSIPWFKARLSYVYTRRFNYFWRMRFCFPNQKCNTLPCVFTLFWRKEPWSGQAGSEKHAFSAWVNGVSQLGLRELPHSISSHVLYIALH